MKPLFCYSTILFYSLFSFAFATICPAVCLTVRVETACKAMCGEPAQSCESKCSQSSSRSCENVDPLACCSGAYGTQNSLRLAVECPAPDKTHAYVELSRVFKDVDILISAAGINDLAIPTDEHCSVFPSLQSSQVANMISTTVLRI